MRILIAGYGYVGVVLGQFLAADGHDVYGLRRSGASRAHDNVRVVAGNLSDPGGLENVPSSTDVVFFTAAPDRSDEAAYRSVYVDGLRHLKARLGPKARVIFTSSTAVYGQDDGAWVDESSETKPGSFRGRVLLEAEALADVSLRLAGIYGPERTRALDKLRRGEAKFSPGRFMNFIHRDDAALALRHLLGLTRPARVYIGADDEPVESELFHRWLAEASGSPPPAPGPPAGRNKRSSNRKLRGSGFVPRYPTFRHYYRELLSAESPSRARLAPCPASPNCVSSEAFDASQRIPALTFRTSPEQARRAVVDAIVEAGGEVVSSQGGHVHAEFTSTLFRFVDDVDVVVDAPRKRIDFRSASRVGYSDLGVNRRRMNTITSRLLAAQGFLIAPDDER